MKQEDGALIKQLGMLVGEISETCYCAGWLYGTEYFVPGLHFDTTIEDKEFELYLLEIEEISRNTCEKCGD